MKRKWYKAVCPKCGKNVIIGSEIGNICHEHGYVETKFVEITKKEHFDAIKEVTDRVFKEVK